MFEYIMHTQCLHRLCVVIAQNLYKKTLYNIIKIVKLNGDGVISIL